MSDLLTAVAIIFIVSGPFLLVANRFNLPAAPLLIVAGLIAGAVIEEQLTLELAQFGIALLVFTFGVSIQFSALESVIEDGEQVAFGQIIAVGFLGTGFGVLVGLPAGEAIYLGIAAALSSTIVGTALLQTEIRQNLVQGRLSQSIQFVQDVVAVGIVLVIGAAELAPDPIAQQLGYGVVFLVAAYVFNRYVFGILERLAGDSEELLIIGVISMLVVFIGAGAAAEIPIVVGAFAAGLAVQHDPFEHIGLFNGLESIKDFFIAVFFVTVGALVVIPFVEIGTAESVEKLVLVAGIVFLTVIVKPIITIAILIYRGYEARTATITGLNLDQVSEFAIIIAIEAFVLELLTQSVFDAVILAAAITMITSSLTGKYDEQIYRRLTETGLIVGRHDKINKMSFVPMNINDHIIILGYGQKGRRLVEVCEEHDQPYIVIENDPARHDRIRRECEAYVFGDGMEPYAWEKAKVEDAKLIVSTARMETISRRVLSFDFDAPLILRAEDEQLAQRLLDDGATYVTVPDLLASEQIIKQIRQLLEGEITKADLQAAGRERL